jgi:hypothetical protein
MTMREFIRQNRAAIDTAINAVVYRYDGKGGAGTVPDPPPTYDDDERRLWIVNDEGLYLWARSCGVDA